MSNAGERLHADRWAGDLGEKWNRHLEQLERSIEAVGAAALAAVRFKPAEHVLDIGCGAGPTTLAIAKLVGPRGSATGVDVSPALIETARRRAAALANVEFVCGDAATTEVIGAPFDRLFSRFGVMFFDDPHAAFRHIRTFAKDGAQALFAVWGPVEENPWVGELAAVPARYVELPRPEPNAPGPFAFADPAYVTNILTGAGFGDVSFEAWRGDQTFGGAGTTADAAADLVMDATFIGGVLEDQPESIRRKARDDLRAILAAHESPEGVRLGAMAWLICATAR